MPCRQSMGFARAQPILQSARMAQENWVWRGSPARATGSKRAARAGQLAGSRIGPATMSGCPESPTNSSATTARRGRSGAGSSTPSPRWRRRHRAPLCLGRPASARGRRHLPRAGRDRRPRLAAQPRAAADRRGRMAADLGGVVAARRTARTGAARPLRRGPPGRRRRAAGGGDRRQRRISAPGVRRARRRAATISISMPPISAAGPTGAGGCWATAPRRRRAPAMRWKIAWCCRAPSPRSTSR